MKTIAEQNDEFRSTFGASSRIPGRVILTSGVDALSDDERSKLFEAIRTFSAFEKSNDPYGEHDFGKVTLDETDFFWKIDYYDLSYEYGSPEPADVSQTRRVMTIMLAEEY